MANPRLILRFRLENYEDDYNIFSACSASDISLPLQKVAREVSKPTNRTVEN